MRWHHLWHLLSVYSLHKGTEWKSLTVRVTYAYFTLALSFLFISARQLTGWMLIACLLFVPMDSWDPGPPLKFSVFTERMLIFLFICSNIQKPFKLVVSIQGGREVSSRILTFKNIFKSFESNATGTEICLTIFTPS